MNVPQINAVKEILEDLKSKNQIVDWELPYENLLTRLSAAIFFVQFDGLPPEPAWKALRQFEAFSYKANTESLLSQLEYQVTFNHVEKEKNIEVTTEAGS